MDKCDYCFYRKQTGHCPVKSSEKDIHCEMAMEQLFAAQRLKKAHYE